MHVLKASCEFKFPKGQKFHNYSQFSLTLCTYLNVQKVSTVPPQRQAATLESNSNCA